MKKTRPARTILSQSALAILIAYFLVCMILQPAKYISQSLNGITAWAFNVLPSVLPFMFFTKILSSASAVESASRPFSVATTRLFKTPAISAYTFLMAILSGYPVGSRMIADLYLQGKISRQAAFKMSSFCSTSGPMFIIGAVGVGMFQSAKIGYVLFASHILGAIANGICWRNLKTKNDANETNSLPTQTEKPTLSDIVTNSTLSILSVGCLITIFFIIIETLSPLFSFFPSALQGFLEGTIEITKGSISLSALPNKTLATILCSFVISFGGISTILQSITMLNKVKMPTSLFVLQKLTHALLSCIATVLIVLVFGV